MGGWGQPPRLSIERILSRQTGTCSSGRIGKSTLFERHVRTQCRDVAQPGRALAWGARGRQFKSARPDQFLAGRSMLESGNDFELPTHEALQS